MTSAARLLCVLLSSVSVQAVIYPDKADADCLVGLQCSSWQMVPAVRGLCVTGAAAKMCWDACNLAHAPKDFSIDLANQQGIALMVKQFRTGMRGADSCEGAVLTPTCNPGERCTPAGLTWGRGMCVTSITGAGNQCLDMCDDKNVLTVFHDTPGKQAGTVNIVESVRAGRDPEGLTTCPMPTVWLWLWIPLLLLCSVGGCAGAFFLFTQYKKVASRGRQSKQNYREPEQQFLEEQPYDDYAGGPKKKGIGPPPAEMEAMPVVEQYAQPETVQPQMNMFGGEPNLMAGLAPQTAGAYNPVTMPQAGSQHGGSGGGAMGTQLPAYGAYGAYGGAANNSLNQTVFPTGSMRIG